MKAEKLDAVTIKGAVTELKARIKALEIKVSTTSCIDNAERFSFLFKF